MDTFNKGKEQGSSSSSRVLSTIPPRILAAIRHLDLSSHVSFEKTKVISAGAFGDVSKAQCLIPGRGSTTVAIKRLRFQMEEHTKTLFETEVYIWAKLTHENVLPFLGYAFDQSGYPLLVSEWMLNGSAWDYAMHNLDCDLVQLAAGIAEGLIYLHKMDVIHSDIKPANIVVSEAGNALICDFGSSRISTATASQTLADQTEGIQGTPNYLSYELVALPKQSHSKQSDVWSFGMTLYALLTQKHPYAQVPKENVSNVIAARKLPPFPSSEPSWAHSRLEARDIFWSICQLCWDHDSSSRVDMPVISSILRNPGMHDNIFRAHQLSERGALYEALQGLLVTLEAISIVVDDVSAIRPNLTSALEATSTLTKKTSMTIKSDKKVVDLVQNALKVLELAKDDITLRYNLRILEEPLVHSLQLVKMSCDLVMECGTSERLLGELESEKLNGLILSHLSCSKACNSVLARHNAAIKARRSQEVNVKLLKELLAPTELYEYDRPTCLENTRVEIRREIIDWANSTKSPNVLWLNGVAGCGKSTISRTIAEYFHEVSRLGSSVFFEREKSDPSSVIPTIAFELAMFDSSIGARISDQVNKDKDILSAKPALQFSKLLLQPLSESPVAMQEPVIFIIDALDECGTIQRRRDLIQVLRKELSKLPLNIRILITSRQETDIVLAFSSEPSAVRAVELDCTSDTSQSDVQRYVQVEMKKLLMKGMKIPKGWPWEANIILLGKAASGLFIWASTAVKLVANSDNSFNTLEGLIRDMSSLGQFGLDDLYATVLRGSGIAWENKTSKTRFSRVLGLVILGKAPFTVEAMDAFLGFSRVSSSRLVLTKFRSLVSYSTSAPVRLFHVSFADYLLSPNRSEDPWSIDIQIEKLHYAARCFFILEDKLHFNICNLETSFISNDDVTGLDERIRSNIPSELGYACRHWAQSLNDVSSSMALCQKLNTFAHDYLLYWFEVLSLTKSFRRLVGPALLDAITWSTTIDPMLSSFLWDAYKLASVFEPPISQRTSHIYVSMLPLTRQDSKVSAHYAKRMTSIVAVAREGIKPATALLKTLIGHDWFVSSVTLSADGKRIASGSWDKTVRLWDAESGESVLSPLEGHTKEVTSVVFSSDGKRIASGSNDNTVRIWKFDPESDRFVSKLLEGHSKEVNSVAFSPDGNFVVSGSDDNSICLWEVESSQIIWSSSREHASAVLSVSFSADGRHVSSGSRDGTIQILDATSGQVLLSCKGHRGGADSVAFSPDGKSIVSGSWDKTARIWNIESGQIAPGHILVGHTDAVFSASFSPSGKRVVSGSFDHTIRVWDVESGRIVSGPFRDHTNCVFSVVFSTDGMRVISGSSDNTVRVWDAESGENIVNTFERFTRYLLSVTNDGRRVAFSTSQDTIQIWDAQNGELISETSDLHMADLISLAFSNDGKQLVSGARDDTIWVWDAESGKPVSGPFKGHLSVISSVMFSPDDKRVVSGSNDETIRIWNKENGETVSGPFKGHSGDVTYASILPDGRRVVSGSKDGSVRVWNMETGQLVLKHYFRNTDAVITPSNAIVAMAISPDGTRATSGSQDGTLRMWDLENGVPISDPFKGHSVPSLKLSMAYSTDGKYIISGSHEETIKAWDAESREPTLLPFEAPTDKFDLLAFSSNRQYVAYSDRNGIIRVSNTSRDCQASVTTRDSLTSDWNMTEDGWVRSLKGELLLWIPPDIRPSLWLPHTTALFGCQFSTRLDFKDCMIGETWAKCFDPDLRE